MYRIVLYIVRNRTLYFSVHCAVLTTGERLANPFERLANVGRTRFVDVGRTRVL